MSRNNKDWLRVTALLAGEKEQYGVVFPDARVTVLLKHDSIRDSFQLVIFTEFTDDTYTLSVTGYGRDISEARRSFARTRTHYANRGNSKRLEMKENK